MTRLFVFCMIALMTAIGMGQEVIVRPSNHNGWVFSVATPNKTSTARWLIGNHHGVNHFGNGALWLYTGNNDGVVLAKNSSLKGVKVSDIGKLRYRTYTAGVLPNIAPQLVLRIDTTGDGKGDVSLFYEPSFQGSIPRNQWAEWNTISGKWWSDKTGIGDLRNLDAWLKEHNTNATIDYVQIQAGTWTDPNSVWGRAWLGVDIVNSVAGLGKDLVYNFEPEPAPAIPAPKPNVKPIVIFNPLVVVSPKIINPPTFYIDQGQKVGKKPAEAVVEPDSEPKAVVADSYKTTDGTYVPLLFNGNTYLKKILSQIGDVGNPDKLITGGGAFKFGEVPFYISKDRPNVWDALAYEDEEEHKLIVKAGLEGVVEVHTIMNLTVWGNEKSELFIEFRGSAGAYHKVDLVADRDVRDWHKRTDDNLIAPSYVVWSRPINIHQGHTPCEVRLDSQFFKLPAEFAKQELISVTIVDKGGKNSHRVFVVGITAKIKAK